MECEYFVPIANNHAFSSSRALLRGVIHLKFSLQPAVSDLITTNACIIPNP
jgi:hypothetical protein